MQKMLPTTLTQPQNYLHFIPKNTLIPTKLNNVKQKKYQPFIKAYKSADFDNIIFNDADFHIYALNGVGQELKHEDVMNLLIMMNALMTYTKHLNIKPEDKSGKQLSQMGLVFFKKNIELELKLINAIVANYHFTAEKINILKDNIQNLPEFQRYFIKITPDTENVYSASLYSQAPIFLSDCKENLNIDEPTSFFIPSFSLIQCILNVMELDIKIFPVFGKITPAITLQLRQQSLSPLQIYCTDVKHNLTTDDDCEQLIFDLLCHDFLNLFKLFHIGKNHYNFIFNWFIPKLQNLQSVYQENVLIESIHNCINFLVDADFKCDYLAKKEGNFVEIMKASFHEILTPLATKEDLLKLITEAIFNLLLGHYDYLKSNYAIDSPSLARLLCATAKNYHHEVATALLQKLDSEKKTSQANNPHLSFPPVENVAQQTSANTTSMASCCVS